MEWHGTDNLKETIFPIKNATILPEKLCNDLVVLTQILTKSNIIDLSFLKSANNNNKFWLTWHTVGCGGTILADKMQLNVNVTRDIIPEADFCQCSWTVFAPIGKVIRVHINALLLPEITEAQHIIDGLFVRNLKFKTFAIVNLFVTITNILNFASV